MDLPDVFVAIRTRGRYPEGMDPKWGGAVWIDCSETGSTEVWGAGDLGLGRWLIPGQILPSRRTSQSDELVEISYTRSGDFSPNLVPDVPEVIVLGCKTAFPTLAHAPIQAATLSSTTDYF
jgi:hypothetical protein